MHDRGDFTECTVIAGILHSWLSTEILKYLHLKAATVSYLWHEQTLRLSMCTSNYSV